MFCILAHLNKIEKTIKDYVQKNVTFKPTWYYIQTQQNVSNMNTTWVLNIFISLKLI